MPFVIWTQDQINQLKELYPHNTEKTISEKLNIVKGSVNYMIRKLGLAKLYGRSHPWTVKRNKAMGRDLSLEALAEIALKFKSRGEFQVKDVSAYQTARRAGIIDEICEHMLPLDFSIPQLVLRKIMDFLLNTEGLYNAHKIIPPYEIDLFYPNFNLGFEYQGKRWHQDNPRDSIKLKIFKEKGINIIYIIENSRHYEKDVKNQLIQQLDKINAICGASITENDILSFDCGDVYKLVYNKEDLFDIAKKYDSFTEFHKKEVSAYTRLRRLKFLDEATSHMADRIREHTPDSINKTISKYTQLGDLIKNDWGTYGYIRKHKLGHLIDHLKNRNPRVNFTLDDIKEKIKLYTRKCDFIAENESMYSYLVRKGFLNLISHLISFKQSVKISRINDIKERIKAYTRKCDFRRENKSMYLYLKARKLTGLISHLKKARNLSKTNSKV